MVQYRKYLKNQTLPGMTEMETDQMKGLELPHVVKPSDSKAVKIDLVPPDQLEVGGLSLFEAISSRQSCRNYSGESISIKELSFLLWSTQGIKKVVKNGAVTLRNVPSGGGMHPFETYLLINNVDTINPGIYRYLPIEHQLVEINKGEIDRDTLNRACNNQTFAGECALVFVWTVRPYRTEWRYGADSLKDILISNGHICQNLYLSCEAINTGVCAIVSYHQERIDKLIGVDGEEEMTLYLATVGKKIN